MECTFCDKFGKCELTGNDCHVELDEILTESMAEDECEDFEVHIQYNNTPFDMNDNRYYL